MDSDLCYWHWTKRLTYTSGVKHMATIAGAHWLIDAVASHLPDWRLVGEEFLVWKLKVNEDRTARLACEDGNDTELLFQDIEYSDYPESTCELFLVVAAGGPGTPALLMLPSEY